MERVIDTIFDSIDTTSRIKRKHSEDYVSEFLENASKTLNTKFQPTNLLPGDNVTSIVTNQFVKGIILGRGLIEKSNEVYAVNAGTLQYSPPSTYWVDSNSKIYIPNLGDQIVGIIEDKGSDYYKVNIFSGSIAMLPRLAFEGASKRNKPELKRGDFIYGKVTLANKEFDTEITCISSFGTKKEWSSGETIYGELKDGVIIKVSILKARSMLLPDNVVLTTLGKYFAYEVAIGMNGLIWIKSKEILHAIIIRNAILNSEFLNDIQSEAMVEKLCAFMRQK